MEATGFSKLFCFAATTMATPLYSRQVIHLFLSSFFHDSCVSLSNIALKQEEMRS